MLVLKRWNYKEILGELVALQIYARLLSSMLAFVIFFKMQRDYNLSKSGFANDFLSLSRNK